MEEKNVFIKNMSQDIEDQNSDRRINQRFETKISARYDNQHCSVLNISDKGILLQSDKPLFFIPLEKSIDFELQLNGEWVTLYGKIMWSQCDIQHSKIGIFIQNAPEPYFNFLKELYER